MNTPTPDNSTTSASSARSQPRMTFLGFPIEKAAVVAEGLMIFGGIALALLIWLSSHLNGRIKIAEALATSEAISGANSRASIAVADAAIERAGTANERAAEANERTKAHEVEIGKQQERAALAEKGLLELKQKVEWRSIGRTSGEPLIAALRAANPKGPVRIFCVLGDPEGNEFANQLDGILKSGGWTVVDTQQGVYTGGNPKGWGLMVRSLNAPPPSVVPLRAAFAIAGFPLQIMENPSVPVGEVGMLVGIKGQ